MVRHVARAHGFLDPISVLGSLHRFAQPSEVAEPLELLRAGVVFHARGLLNARVVQHNLDWVWPYWIERQFDPEDVAFIPRAFSITHVNLTHRNWTAVGLPQLDEMPVVGPRGLLMPFWDSWSIDSWVFGTHGELVPSRLSAVEQTLSIDPNLRVTTRSEQADIRWSSSAAVVMENNSPVCKLEVTARSEYEAILALSIRPYNGEGVSFIHELEHSADGAEWRVNREQRLQFDPPPRRTVVSDYRSGDVYRKSRESESRGERPGAVEHRCDVGMATGAALYRIAPGTDAKVTVSIPLESEKSRPRSVPVSWQTALGCHAQLRGAPLRIGFLYDASVRVLILLSPGTVYPGPYTYKRFWFRDASFILKSLLTLGFVERVEAILDGYPKLQDRNGYFISQEGEWDSNGEVLWILDEFCRFTKRPPKPEWAKAILSGADWIIRKRLPSDDEALHAGLLPAGFSAEHLGPNDYYYWDDFWGLAGLRSAARLASEYGELAAARRFEQNAEDFEAAIHRSISKANTRIGSASIPASPYRRMDSGAIGSIVASYPLRLIDADDNRMRSTIEFLIERCFIKGAFFQDMIHSGLNAYLTLHVAQCLLRDGDERYGAMIERVAELATPTGQWPEAIHPLTLGGCMGDGQHSWACAEWVMMLRNCFVREEGDSLVIGSGVLKSWVGEEPLTYGPVLTAFGTITVTLERSGEEFTLSWIASWHLSQPPPLFATLGDGVHRVESHDVKWTQGGSSRSAITGR